MKVVLDIGLLSYKSPKSIGFGKTDFWLELFQKFNKFEMFSRLKYFGVEGDEKKNEIKNSETLAKELKNLKFKSYIVSDIKDEIEAKIKITFGIRESSLRLRLIKDVQKNNLNIELGQLVEVYNIFHGHFDGKVEFPFVSAIIDWDERNYQRPGVQIIWKKFSEFGLIDIVHFSNAETEDEKLIAEKSRISSLPSNVARECFKEYCIINWVNNVTNENEISDRLSIRAKWFYENAKFEVDTNYNEFGDELFSIVNPIPTDYLTFYSNFRRAGFKGTVLGPNNQYDKELFDELKKWLEQGKTPDGRPLSQVNLILPSRKDAVAVRPIADQHGFNLVLYPSKDGNFWNPFPDEG